MSARVWFAIVIASAGVAGASPEQPFVEVHMTAELPTGQPPRIEATVIDGPHMLLSSFALRTDDGHETPATSVRRYAQGNEPIAVAIVFERPVWPSELDAVPRDQDLFDVLPNAIDRLGLASRVPAGSEAVLIDYGDVAAVRMPLSPIAELRGSKVGTHKRDTFGNDLVRGIELGLGELEHSAAPIKVLIVVSRGGGPDYNAFAGLKKRAARSNIRTFGIIHQVLVPAYGDAISAMIHEPIWIETPHGLLNALQKVFADATDRYYLTFASEALPWDGKYHDLYVVASGVEFDPVTLTMPARKIAMPWWRTWFAQLGLALGLLVLTALLARWRFAATR